MATLRGITNNSATVAAGGTISIDVPSGVQDGDVLEIGIIHDGTGTAEEDCFTVSGWTSVAFDRASIGAAISVFRRVASSEPASYTINVTNGLTSQECRVSMIAFAPGAGETITYSTSGSWEFQADTDVTAPAITVPAGGIYHAWFFNDGSRTVTTPPSGLTLGVDVLGTSVAMYSYYDLSATGGSTSATVVWNATEGSAGIGIAYSVEGSATTTVPVAMYHYNRMRSR